MALVTSVGIFSIDGGKTTGCAAGVFDLRRRTVASVMKRALAKGNLTTWEVRGDNVKQNWTIAESAVDHYYRWHVEQSLIFFNNFYVVAEDFNLRTMSADLSPVERNSGIETLLAPCFKKEWPSVWSKQSASEAQGFCNDSMLDKWGLLKGKSPHERDALRHIARRLDRLL